MNKCIFLTGGGTAGHVTLNIKLQTELKKYFDKIIYIGSENGIEKELISRNTDYHYESITTVKLVRGKFLKNLGIPLKLKKGVSECVKLIKKYKPDVIFSKGGYVGLPLTIAGKKTSVPVICHESDFSMGLSNKIAMKYAKTVCTNFEETAIRYGKKCIFTGMPVSISKHTKNESKKLLKIKTEKPIILVTGGSSGAKSINEFIFQNVEKLSKNYFIIHITGKNNLNKNIALNDYMQIEYTDKMPEIMNVSDYAISRAGANTCIELLSNKILTIFVPLSKGSSRGDQIENANYLKNKNLCSVVYQNNLNINSVENELLYLQKSAKEIIKNINNANFTDGTQKIMREILKMANSNIK